VFELKNIAAVPHFDKEEDFISGRASNVDVKKSINIDREAKIRGDIVDFKKSIGIGEEVKKYSVRLRYHPSYGDGVSTGHISFDYQAYYSDGTQSKWYSLSESAGTVSSFKGGSFIEIPLGDFTEEQDIRRMQGSIKDYSLKRWAHSHYDQFSSNCVDTARYAIKKILPDFVASDLALPREFALASLKQKFNELEKSSLRKGKSKEELRALDLRALECLKATIEFMQTGYNTTRSSRFNIHDGFRSSSLSRFPSDTASTLDSEYSLDPDKFKEDEYNKLLNGCPKVSKEMYKLHHYLIEIYIPYCKGDKYDPNRMRETLSSINNVLAASVSDNKDKHFDPQSYFNEQKSKFGKDLRTAVMSFFFYLIRDVTSTKFERKIQKGEDVAKKTDEADEKSSQQCCTTAHQ